MPRWPQRKSLRKVGWDYSAPGFYFITITTRRGRHYFGVNDRGRMIPSAAGLMVAAEWCAIASRFPHVRVDRFVVMPNHLHGVLRLDAAPRGAPVSLGQIVMAFKSRTTVAYIRGVREQGWPPFRGRLWHRNYHERIIFSTLALARIRSYIEGNPRIHWLRELSR